MFPVNVSMSCPTVEDIPMVPAVVMIALMYGIIPYIGTHYITPGDYLELGDHGIRHSISWTIRSYWALVAGSVGLTGALVYSAICFSSTDPVLLGIICLGLIILELVLIFNGDPDSKLNCEICLTTVHKIMAAAAFTYIAVTSCLTVYYFSQSDEKHGGRAIAAYILFGCAVWNVLGMVISLMMDEWGNATSIFEWLYGTCFLILIGLIPGQVGTLS